MLPIKFNKNIAGTPKSKVDNAPAKFLFQTQNTLIQKCFIYIPFDIFTNFFGLSEQKRGRLE